MVSCSHKMRTKAAIVAIETEVFCTKTYDEKMIQQVSSHGQLFRPYLGLVSRHGIANKMARGFPHKKLRCEVKQEWYNCGMCYHSHIPQLYHSC